jgi:hypothetical protein
MNCFFLFAFLTIVYFVKTISTGPRRSPRIKGKSPESGRDEIEGLEVGVQAELDESKEEEVESDYSDLSYDESESISEEAQGGVLPSTPVAAQLSTEYNTPIVTILGGKTGKKKKTKENSNDTNETIIKNSGKFVLIN